MRITTTLAWTVMAGLTIPWAASGRRTGPRQTCHKPADEAGRHQSRPTPNRPARRPKTGSPRAARPCSRASPTRPSSLSNKAVAADKTKTSYRLALARAYRYAGKDEQAIANLEEILKTAPDHVEAGQMLGELYTTAKRWKDVVRVLDPLLKYRHDYPTYHMLAEAQNNLGDRDKARKSLRRGPQAQPAKRLGPLPAGQPRTWPRTSSPWPPIPITRHCVWGWTARCSATSSARPISTCGITSARSACRPSSPARRARSTARGT